MFEANKKLDDDDEEGGKPSFGVVVSMGKKSKPAFNPSAKLDDEGSSGEMDDEGRFGEAMEILAKLINSGRVEPDKLGQCIREAFQSLESEPHEEGEHTNEKEEA